MYALRRYLTKYRPLLLCVIFGWGTNSKLYLYLRRWSVGWLVSWLVRHDPTRPDPSRPDPPTNPANRQPDQKARHKINHISQLTSTGTTTTTTHKQRQAELVCKQQKQKATVHQLDSSVTIIQTNRVPKRAEAYAHADTRKASTPGTHSNLSRRTRTYPSLGDLTSTW